MGFNLFITTGSEAQLINSVHSGLRTYDASTSGETSCEAVAVLDVLFECYSGDTAHDNTTVGTGDPNFELPSGSQSP